MIIRISPTPWRYVPEHKLVEDAKRGVVMYGLAEPTHGRLAAAAPDLEAALRELVARIDALNPPDMPYDQWIDGLEPELTGARSALRKAKEG